MILFNAEKVSWVVYPLFDGMAPNEVRHYRGKSREAEMAYEWV